MARTNSKAHGLIVGGLLRDDSAEHVHLEIRQEIGLARRVQLEISERLEVRDDHSHTDR